MRGSGESVCCCDEELGTIREVVASTVGPIQCIDFLGLQVNDQFLDFTKNWLTRYLRAGHISWSRELSKPGYSVDWIRR